MKRLIYSNENIQITEQSVKKLLKQGCKRIGWSCVVKNGGVQLSSYERDYYCYFWLSDLVNYLKNNPEYFDEEYIVDVIDDIPSESAGVRSAWEGKPDITEFRIKYLGIEDPGIKEQHKQKEFEIENKDKAAELAECIAEVAQTGGYIKEGYTKNDLAKALLRTAIFNAKKNLICIDLGKSNIRKYDFTAPYDMLLRDEAIWNSGLFYALKKQNIKKPLLEKLPYVDKYYLEYTGDYSGLINFKLV